ncbi:hypothetical protein EIP91_003625 [Steccherinum ochraceum]|uniref:Peptidase A1 domain-containing protein n=1 Tax=Steccherinum ochraceum TaxID=92696 RepID=A0A4R0RLT6_9APHY|nr:hypothetical protein EIP91_003625 [Steccherinum ochraceum]
MAETTPAGRPIVAREKTAPFLIRTFIKIGTFHRLGQFEDGNLPIADEQQIFTWKDATLREVLTTLRNTAPQSTEYRHPLARYTFRAIYADSTNRGRFAQKELGMVYSRDILGEPGTVTTIAPRLLRDDEDLQGAGSSSGDGEDGKDGSKLSDERTLDELRFVPGDYLCVMVMLPKSVAVPTGPPGGELSIKGAVASAAAANGARGRGDGGWGGNVASGNPFGSGRGGGGHWRGESSAPRGGRGGGRGEVGGRDRDRDRDRDRRVPPPRRESPPRRGGWGDRRGDRRDDSRSRSPPRRKNSELLAVLQFIPLLASGPMTRPLSRFFLNLTSLGAPYFDTAISVSVSCKNRQTTYRVLAWPASSSRTALGWPSDVSYDLDSLLPDPFFPVAGHPNHASYSLPRCFDLRIALIVEMVGTWLRSAAQTCPSANTRLILGLTFPCPFRDEYKNVLIVIQVSSNAAPHIDLLSLTLASLPFLKPNTLLRPSTMGAVQSRFKRLFSQSPKPTAQPSPSSQQLHKLVRPAKYPTGSDRPSLYSAYARAARRYGFETGKYAGFAKRDNKVVKVKGLEDKATDHEVPAESIQNGYVEYVVEVKIGTPGVTLHLDFDTGSSDLWVWSTEIAGASRHPSHTIFDPRKSKTAKKSSGSWSISYGDGSSASGDVYTDVVSVAGVSIPNQSVELAGKLSASFLSDGGNDGLLGLAWPSINTVQPRGVKTPVENMIEQKLIEQPVFTAKLSRGDEPGFYSFGFIDPNVTSSPITYTDVDNSQGFWQVSSESYSINGKTTARNGNTTILDTGTTLLLVSDDVVEAIYGQIDGATYDDNQGGWKYPTNATLPKVSFAVGSELYTVNAADLGMGPADEGFTFGGIQSRGDWISTSSGTSSSRVSTSSVINQGEQTVGLAQRDD